jgi:branched-chain amino acid transport system permease protein
MLRLKGGEFAIGMWVVSELNHSLVNLDTLVRGEKPALPDRAQRLRNDSRRALTIARSARWLACWRSSSA